MTILKKTEIFVLTLSMLCLHAATAISAPVGNIGDPGLWEGGLVREYGVSHIFVALDFDQQKIHHPKQIGRQKWDDPRTAIEEDRHYEQIRASRYQLTCSGIKVGTTLSRGCLVYALSGVCNSDILFRYWDTTIKFGYSEATTFKSDTDFYYGIGTSAIFHEGTFGEDMPFKLGMDIKYRRFDIEVDNLEADGTFYSTTLDEIQLALVLSAETGRFSPYLGAKISSMTGKEHYINKNTKSSFFDERYINYQDDITWSENLGYVAGGTFFIKETFSLNIESRFGDEEGLGCSATIRF